MFYTDLVFKVSYIRKVHETRLVDVDHKRRRVRANLCAVVHLECAASMSWVWMRILCLVNDLVDRGCCQAGEALFLYLQRHRQYLLQALTGLG